jgi:phosphate transport system substrate-binding protein
MKHARLALALVSAVALLGACASNSKLEEGPEPAQTQTIAIGGSSTVFPISREAARRFREFSPHAVEVDVSGTRAGFEQLCSGKLDIAGASRPITQKESLHCREAGIEILELPIAYDGIAVVVHKDNDWVDGMPIDELRKLWAPSAQDLVVKWNDVRADWPAKAVRLYGPGCESGTFDYFTLATVREARASRTDYWASEDDDALVDRIAGDPMALGYLGYAYYINNQDRLKALGIDDGNPHNGAGFVHPSKETIRNGAYQPLSRPLFLYVRARAIRRSAVADFLDFYLEFARNVVQDVGYVPLPKSAFALVRKRFDGRQTGSVFQGVGAELGLTVEDVLGAETVRVVSATSPD